MKYTYTAIPVQNLATDAVIVFAAQFDNLSKSNLKPLDKFTDGAIGIVVESGEFSGKDGEVAQIVLPKGMKAKRLMLAGLGKKEKLTPDSFRRAMGTIAKSKGAIGVASAAVHFLDFNDPACFQAAIEGYLLGSYKFLEYKSGEAAENPGQTRFTCLCREPCLRCRQTQGRRRAGQHYRRGPAPCAEFLSHTRQFPYPAPLCRKSQRSGS